MTSAKTQHQNLQDKLDAADSVVIGLIRGVLTMWKKPMPGA